MVSIGEINIFVTDLERAVRFWGDGMQLKVAEREQRGHSGHARLDFEDGSPSIRLFWPAAAWEAGQRPEYGTLAMIAFDVATSDFDATLARLLENGGTLEGAVETYGDLRVAQLADPDGNSFELVEIPANDG